MWPQQTQSRCPFQEVYSPKRRRVTRPGGPNVPSEGPIVEPRRLRVQKRRRCSDSGFTCGAPVLFAAGTTAGVTTKCPCLVGGCWAAPFLSDMHRRLRQKPCICGCHGDPILPTPLTSGNPTACLPDGHVSTCLKLHCGRLPARGSHKPPAHPPTLGDCRVCVALGLGYFASSFSSFQPPAPGWSLEAKPLSGHCLFLPSQPPLPTCRLRGPTGGSRPLG